MAAAYVVTSGLGGVLAAMLGAMAGAELAMLGLAWLAGGGAAAGSLAMIALHHRETDRQTRD